MESVQANITVRNVLILFLLFFTLTSNGQLTVEGFIVNNKKDTIKTTIWKNKKKRLDKKRNYSRITIIDSTDKEKVLSPEQITAYSKENIYYRSIRPKNRSSYFVKNIIYGNVELYYFKTLEKYLFKKKSEKGFYIVDTELQTYQESTLNGNVNPSYSEDTKLVSFDSEKGFRNFFIPYFSDCPLISNKIQSQLYKYNDIEIMFKHYNERCN
jgi:hypothetical protein